MSDQIFPLNVDPESPLKPKNNKKKKPTFKQWFNERKRMLGLVLGVCLVTVGAIVYPYLNLGELFKGQIEIPDYIDEINIQPKQEEFNVGDQITISFKGSSEFINKYGNTTGILRIKLIEVGGDDAFPTSKKDFIIKDNNGDTFTANMPLYYPGKYYFGIEVWSGKKDDGTSFLSKKIWNNEQNPITVKTIDAPKFAEISLSSDILLPSQPVEIQVLNIPVNQKYEITIYNDEEQIIRVFEKNSNNKYLWDGKNTDNKYVKEGMYMVDLSGLIWDQLKLNFVTVQFVPRKPINVYGESLTVSAQVNNKGGVNIRTNKEAVSTIMVLNESSKVIKARENINTLKDIQSDVDLGLATLSKGKYKIKVETKGILADGTNSGEVSKATLSFEVMATTENTGSATIPLLLTSTPNTNSIATTEAVTYTLKATSKDVFGPSIICFIEYGDGKGEEKLCGTGDTVTFTAHKYTESDTYTAKAGTRVKSGVENIYEIESSLSYTVYSPVASVLLIEPDNLAPKIEDKDEGVKVKFTLTAKNLAGPYDYEIDYGDGEDDSSTDQINDTQTFTHKYDEEGEYEVVAEITDSEKVRRKAIYELEIKADYNEDEDKDEDEDEEDDKETNCTNNKDDDGDGEKDYEDSDCKIPESQKIVISDVRVSRSPFNPSVNASSILYKLNRDSLVTIEVFDSSKKRVATLLDGKLKQALTTTGAQANQAEWFYGKVNNDPVGQALPDGTYTYTITAVNPKYATIKDTKSSTVIVNSKDGAIASDWEQTGATSTSGTGTTGSTSASQTSSTRTAQTSSTKTALSTSTNQTSNLAALTMQNNPPGTTAGTGPEMLIYLLLPAVSAFALTRKK